MELHWILIRQDTKKEEFANCKLFFLFTFDYVDILVFF